MHDDNPIHPVTKLQRDCARLFGVTLSDLRGTDRHKSVTRARHLAMLLCRERFRMSYPEIGRLFGDRDHTTAISGIKRAQKLIETEPFVRAAYDAMNADAPLRQATPVRFRVAV